MSVFSYAFRVGSGSFLVSLANTFSIKERFLEDEQILSKEKRAFLEFKIRELSSKLGISKQIELKEVLGTRTATAYGCTLLPSIAGIVIDPEFVHESSPAELEFILAHELVHIQQNDIPWMLSWMCIAAVITTVVTHLFFPTPIALSIGAKTASLISGVFATRVLIAPWREECADRLGFSICSRKAQEAAPQFFEKERKGNVERRAYGDGFLNRWTLTKEGDDRLAFFHPPLTKRIKYLQDELGAYLPFFNKIHTQQIAASNTVKFPNLKTPPNTSCVVPSGPLFSYISSGAKRSLVPLSIDTSLGL